ncbi:hypothetical protein B0T19DRAFT_133194 [Cercophora scortea]|uniref:Uncharacterized protein n=1 Tax=Cercophora scortea TaxID=314031 RepID=A0AAE0IYM3_9PEZI|nr:hypothetical protein B0T19DRAFT_133194 [Cercophora scortea]
MDWRGGIVWLGLRLSFSLVCFFFFFLRLFLLGNLVCSLSLSLSLSFSFIFGLVWVSVWLCSCCRHRRVRGRKGGVLFAFGGRRGTACMLKQIESNANLNVNWSHAWLHLVVALCRDYLILLCGYGRRYWSCYTDTLPAQRLSCRLSTVRDTVASVGVVARQVRFIDHCVSGAVKSFRHRLSFSC